VLTIRYQKQLPMQLADKKHITMEICTRAQTDKNRQAQSEVVDVLFLRGGAGQITS
jgi:hypothetical protein